jgi:hypothetical protein
MIPINLKPMWAWLIAILVTVIAISLIYNSG